MTRTRFAHASGNRRVCHAMRASTVDAGELSAPEGGPECSHGRSNAAVATDKVPMLPGQTADYSNVSSFQNGITGIFVDISNVPVPANITAADFEFTVGNSSTPGTGSSPGTGWAALGTAPTVTLFSGAGVNGSSRYALTWPAGTISGKWLQVTVKSDTNTGLAKPDVFYFGSAPGESGNTTTDFRVSAADELAARNDPHDFANRAPITDPNDFNRDSFVNGGDEVAARGGSTDFATALKVISVPGLPNAQLSGTGILPVSSLATAITNTVATAAINDGDDSDEKKSKAASTGPGQAGAGIYVVMQPKKANPADKPAISYRISMGVECGRGE